MLFLFMIEFSPLFLIKRRNLFMLTLCLCVFIEFRVHTYVAPIFSQNPHLKNLQKIEWHNHFSCSAINIPKSIKQH